MSHTILNIIGLVLDAVCLALIIVLLINRKKKK